MEIKIGLTVSYKTDLSCIPSARDECGIIRDIKTKQKKIPWINVTKLVTLLSEERGITIHP